MARTEPQIQSAAAAHIEQLIGLTERLTLLLAEQAQAFEARRPQDAAANMAETTRLANQYRHEAQRLRGQAATLLGQVPAPLRARLTRATEAFDAVIARQGRAVNAAKTVTEGLVHAIAEEIAHQRASATAYGPKGAKPTSASAIAVTLNQRA
jgi:hypothetical protein